MNVEENGTISSLNRIFEYKDKIYVNNNNELQRVYRGFVFHSFCF